MNRKTITPFHVLVFATLLTQASTAVELARPVVTDASEPAVERIGPPTFFAPPVERYRLGAPDVNNPAFYPIPQTTVTRETYMAWIEQSGLLTHAKQPGLAS